MPFYVSLSLICGGLIGFLVGISFKRDDLPLVPILGSITVVGILFAGTTADTNQVAIMSLKGAAIFFGSYIIAFAITFYLKRLCRKS